MFVPESSVITKECNAYLGFPLVMRHAFLISLARLTNASDDVSKSMIPMKRDRVQRFGAKSASAATMPLLREEKERRGSLSGSQGREIGTAGGGGGGIEPGGVADGEGIWKGDFAE